jgi:hypothetical protein
MDDFIYFLLVIGWLGYSIYKQSEKKKLKQAARQSEQQGNTMTDFQEQTETEKPLTSKLPTGTDFRKTLEEILLGEQVSMEVIPESEAQSLEVIPEAAVSDENRFQQQAETETLVQKRWNEILKNSPANMPERHPDQAEVSILQESEEEKAYFWDEFDLRKAIIFSEILNPKYVH